MGDGNPVSFGLLGAALERVARPYAGGEALSLELQASLWQLGVRCSAITPREKIVAHLWAMKRGLMQRQPDGDWPPQAA